MLYIETGVMVYDKILFFNQTINTYITFYYNYDLIINIYTYIDLLLFFFRF